MTEVIDSSALVAYCLAEKELNREKMRDFLSRGLFSVDLIISESANAIVTSKRRGITDKATAHRAFEVMLDLAQNNIKLTPQSEIISDAFEISESHNVAIYDALYLAVAKKMKSSLISLDSNQIDFAKKLGVRVQHMLLE
ncbi:MAG: type II toxin-antitoxin system VapC family toxin [Thaumarchaeota archaeon]|nr:type II toxin-antitoxin system VapC family toxin [Nitrososphaerota archaeon]